MTKLQIKRLSKDAIIPAYKHDTDSGLDLYTSEEIYVQSNGTEKVSVGLAFNIPEGHEIQIRPRSGMTSKTPLRVQFGTVDEGYKGEVKVIVDNISDSNFGYTFRVEKGTRIAQAVLVPVIRPEIEEVDEIGTSTRGEGGFGSTGIK